MLHALTFVACTALAGGCFKATFDAPSIPRGDRHEAWRSMYVLGLVGSTPLDVHELCGDAPVAEVRTGGSAVTTLITIGTLFIYTPRKVYVTCGAR